MDPPAQPTPPRRHELLLELGRGGMGTVYLAVARGPGGFSKLKVVKHLRAELASDENFLRMFLDEAKLSARLNHPNVVQTNEVGFDGASYFIEMERLEGQTLDALERETAARGTPVSLAVHLWVLGQMLEGLHYAHELVDTDGSPLHVVHRDVSPHNVFLTYDGAVKLLDFGIAKAADSSVVTATDVIKGKLTYMSPEQSMRRPVDRRGDVFSVGVMMWHALTGKRLWEDTSQAEIFWRLESGELIKPHQVKPDVDPRLETICMRALAAKPEDRFATAAEMRAAIEEHLEHTGERVGPRQVASLMAQVFAEKRKVEHAQIDARMKEIGTGSLRVDLPVLGHLATPLPPEVTATAGPSTVAARGQEGTPSEDGASSPKPAARWQRWSWRAGVLGIAAAVAIGVAVRARAPAVQAPAPPAVASGCRSVAECATRLGQPAVCHADGTCAALASPDCKVLASAADAANERTLWIGTLFPMTGSAANAFGNESVNAADLARADFAEVSRGLPPLHGGGAPRPIGLVVCDDAADVRRAAAHLVEDVRVPAVIGFYASQEVVDLAGSLFAPHDVVAVASQNRSTIISAIPNAPGKPRMVYRTTTTSADSAVPVSRVVSDVFEAEMRASGRIRKDEKTRVVLLRPSTTAGLSVAESVFSRLRFNGKSALENRDAYREVLYGDLSSPDRATCEAAVKDVIAFAPHVIVYVASDGIATQVLGPIERAWPASARYKPRYVANGYLMGDDLLALLGEKEERMRRFLGVNPPATTIANARLTLHYNETHTPKVALTESPGAVYDAFYVLAYAAFAAQEADPAGPSGEAIARAIPRLLPPGPSVDVGPVHILEAFNLLASGAGHVDLNGAATRLDFDPTTGDSPTSFAVLCAHPRGGGAEIVESSAVYSPSAGTLDGLPLRCE